MMPTYHFLAQELRVLDATAQAEVEEEPAG